MSKLEPTRTCSNPTATDELRRMLDERGVEWRGGLPTETMVEADGLDLLYVALPDGRVRAFIRNYLTPEQAVEATLGRGTCRIRGGECDQCGALKDRRKNELRDNQLRLSQGHARDAGRVR